MEFNSIEFMEFYPKKILSPFTYSHVFKTRMTGNHKWDRMDAVAFQYNLCVIFLVL